MFSSLFLFLHWRLQQSFLVKIYVFFHFVLGNNACLERHLMAINFRSALHLYLQKEFQFWKRLRFHFVLKLVFQPQLLKCCWDVFYVVRCCIGMKSCYFYLSQDYDFCFLYGELQWIFRCRQIGNQHCHSYLYQIVLPISPPSLILVIQTDQLLISYNWVDLSLTDSLWVYWLDWFLSVSCFNFSPFLGTFTFCSTDVCLSLVSSHDNLNLTKKRL